MLVIQFPAIKLAIFHVFLHVFDLDKHLFKAIYQASKESELQSQCLLLICDTLHRIKHHLNILITLITTWIRLSVWLLECVMHLGLELFQWHLLISIDILQCFDCLIDLIDKLLRLCTGCHFLIGRLLH